jgi:Lon protease-like protein
MPDLQRHFGLENFSGLLRLFPLPNVVHFPCTLLPLHIFEPRYRQLVADAAASDGCIGITLLKPGWEPKYYENPPVHEVACLGKLIETTKLADGRYNIVLCGVKRVRIGKITSDKPYRTARVDLLEERPVDGRAKEAKGVRDELVRLADSLSAPLLRHPKLACALRKLDAPLGCCCDLMADSLNLSPDAKQRLLVELDPFARARKLMRAVEAQVQELCSVAARRRFPPEPSLN